MWRVVPPLARQWHYGCRVDRSGGRGGDCRIGSIRAEQAGLAIDEGYGPANFLHRSGLSRRLRLSGLGNLSLGA